MAVGKTKPLIRKETPYPRIAVCTTFPAEQFSICAAEMLASFHQYWPKDIKIYVQLDEMPKEQFDTLNNAIMDLVGEDRSFIAGLFEDDQKKFIDRWKNHKPQSYLEDLVKFSHKVFALEKCADAIKDGMDYLIWLDADVITKKPIDYEWLQSLLPHGDEVVSYLGRDTLHPECGFVAYNLKAGGYELLNQMKAEYCLGNFKDYTKGVTDCHVLDVCIKGKKVKNLSDWFEYSVDDIHVWEKTKLAERMTHRKGNRKNVAAENRGKDVKKQAANGVVDVNNMNIKTRNCLDHEKIKANVMANKGEIRAWATITRSSGNGEVVICSAGPSLVNHIDEIKALQKNGAVVVAVKHAIDTLKAHDIKPYAVVLLDPRAHVEGFLKSPDPEVTYFAASMCDPSVVKTLNENKCKVIGYHALVNAGETSCMISTDVQVSGGSATATRSIGLFSDLFGFKTFHIFGLDLCYQQKPDMNEKNADGQPKYMEITIGTHTHKNKYTQRTFFTEGQFLAQSNEIKDIYKHRKDLNVKVYGDGMAGWLYFHHNLHQTWLQGYNKNLEAKRLNTPTFDEYVNAVSRGSEFARGI